MTLKNAHSDISVDKIFAELQKTLVLQGAKQISYDYSDDGRIDAAQFVIKVQKEMLAVRILR